MLTEEDKETLDRLLDMSKSLSVDAYLVTRFEGREPRIRPELQQARFQSGRPEAVHLARRALELAFREARQQQMSRPSIWIDDLSRVDRAAMRAAEALDALFEALHQSPTEAQDLWRPLVVISAPFTNLQATEKAIVRHEKELSADATALWRAREVAYRLSDHAPRRSARLAKTLVNDPRPDEREFVKMLMEMWIYMTGRPPGANETVSLNPFLGFVDASWKDAFPSDQTDRQFIGALRSARKGLTDTLVERLAKSGPPWL